MIFKLLKELPFMFIIAAIICMVAIFVIIKIARNKKQISFPKKIITTIVTILIAAILIVADIWLFVFFIPVHFKKNNIQQQAATISATDIAKEIQTNDSNKTSSQTLTRIDSLKNKKVDTPKIEGKIYTTNRAAVTFLSQGEDEDIEATNNQSAIAINSTTCNIKIIALIKGFQFENQLMQSHFNEPDYMNSDAFPKSEFKGEITNLHAINFSKDGTYNIDATGTLTIHGITKNISVQGSLTIQNKNVSVQSIFKIKRMDYGITTNEIADELQITVKGTLQ